MTYLVLAGICLGLELIFVPLFIKAGWPEKNKKSLVLKMICSTLFIAFALLAVGYKGEFSKYSLLIIVGLFFGFLGDFFLHVNPKPIFFAAGLYSFLCGHIFYTIAFSLELEPGRMFSTAQITAFILIVACIVLVAVVKKINPGKATVHVSLYMGVIVLMLIKRCALGFRLLQSGKAVPGVIIVLGGALFVVSDAILGIILFMKDKNSLPLKAVNLISYYAAQLLIGGSIFFLG
ncbi:MAG: lysoplasmalogenase family protein [Acutalibacteraceae bacterium]|jgi:uncharacterized membrane protein YhhN